MSTVLTTVLNDVSLIEAPLTKALDWFGKAPLASEIVTCLDTFTQASLAVSKLANPSFSSVEQIIEPALEKCLNAIIPNSASTIIGYIKTAISWEQKFASWL